MEEKKLQDKLSLVPTSLKTSQLVSFNAAAELNEHVNRDFPQRH